ncbi:uncharacterized protein METZ01_LOCUS317089, partial [marine metagenome]
SARYLESSAWYGCAPCPKPCAWLQVTA